ncbi:hypothetical protein H109_06532 [Trichophyton interdigitale MR816]|uniref:Uncharacterized protein n=1 Tax=Trichophyton interdigitale (strain MR816) TaxID=1215338 RepID=A0A059J201_TRIIM|nr:hypothetical protein H109_06532 [Trichophyton interdigitale MR816]
MMAAGHLTGNAIGVIETPRIFGPYLRDTQFKRIMAIASALLLFSTLITTYAVRERVLITARGGASQLTAANIFSRLFQTLISLPPRIKAICWTQFWAWIGWFPFLFYCSVWIGEILLYQEASKSDIPRSQDVPTDFSRLGSLALVFFALVALFASILLPLVCSTESLKSSFSPTITFTIGRYFKRIHLSYPDLGTAWMISHIVFAGTMVLAPLTGSAGFATFLVALCGIPWAIACWAPFTFIGEEVNRLCVPVTSRDPTVTMITSATYSRRQDSSSSSPRDHAPSDIELDDGVLMLNHGHDGSDSEDQGGEVPDANISTGELAGIYLGILNVYNTLPQLFSMLVSWVIFRAFEPKLGAPRVTTHAASVKDQFIPSTIDVNTGSANASGLRLFIGALSALLAAESTRRLKRTR